MLRSSGSTSSVHERKLYALIVLLCAVGFVLGLLWVILGFSDPIPARESAWQSTSLAKPEDPQALFHIVSTRPRWYLETGSQPPPVVEEAATPAMEGTPESFRLTGLVREGDQRYALFLPLVVPAGEKRATALLELSEGQTLMGDWVMSHIGTMGLEIRQGKIAQVIRLYKPVSRRDPVN